jgi:hypothetical protein
MAFTFEQTTFQITTPDGFRDLQLPQLHGVVLALDWVASQVHHIWGSAVMVGPGLALSSNW